MFRYDINALRALAVTAVVIFHFYPDLLPGGFVGVDIFFVMSGYLMTSIVLGKLTENNFSLLDFYSARCNRLIPPLLVLCLSLLVFGWLFLSSIDYKVLTKHISSSVVFLSNVTYYTEAGYFDSASKGKWLLHTWSLSAEWQFYLIYPIFLMVLSRVFGFAKLGVVVVITTVILFFVSIYYSIYDKSLAYFLLPSRAWQMLAGGLLYLFPTSIGQGKIKSFIGIILVIFSIVFYSPSLTWPGIYSLMPVVGVCLILSVASGNTILINNPIVNNLGRWSYSIYLWHWPIVVFIAFYGLEEWKFLGVLVSLLLGYISFRFVEQSNNKKPLTLKGLLLSRAILTSGVIFTFSSYIWYSDGALNRFSIEDKIIMSQASLATKDWEFPSTSNLTIDGINLTKIDHGSDRNLLLIGSSHAQQLYPYLLNETNDYNFYMLTASACLPIKSQGFPKDKCNSLQSYSSVIEKIKFDKIVTTLFCYTCNFSGIKDISSELALREKAYHKFLDEILSFGVDLTIIKGEPVGNNFDPRFIVKHLLNSYMEQPLPYVKRSELVYRYRHQNEMLENYAKIDSVKLVDPLDYLCNEKTCRSKGEKGEFIYKDGDHMRPDYVRNYVPYLKDIFGSNK